MTNLRHAGTTVCLRIGEERSHREPGNFSQRRFASYHEARAPQFLPSVVIRPLPAGPFERRFAAAVSNADAQGVLPYFAEISVFARSRPTVRVE